MPGTSHEADVVVRLGAVSYLNVRPLVAGLDTRPDVSIRFDVPAVCARLLNEDAIDLGMVPSITWLDRPGDRIVPGVCIGSEGPVASVAQHYLRHHMRYGLAEREIEALRTYYREVAALGLASGYREPVFFSEARPFP